MISPNAIWHHAVIQREHRQKQNGHRSAVLWFTGLSGAGKSTLAHAVEERLHQLGCRTYVLDGDNVRHGLCGDLGFSAADRSENIRRIGEVANLFVQAGMIVITAFISPYRSDRDRVRAINPQAFNEVYLKADVEECERRDPKGLYAKARQGGIPEFTGISAPYEEPIRPELVIDTKALTVDEAVEAVLRHIERDMQREDDTDEPVRPDTAL